MVICALYKNVFLYFEDIFVLAEAADTIQMYGTS